MRVFGILAMGVLLPAAQALANSPCNQSLSQLVSEATGHESISQDLDKPKDLEESDQALENFDMFALGADHNFGALKKPDEILEAPDDAFEDFNMFSDSKGVEDGSFEDIEPIDLEKFQSPEQSPQPERSAESDSTESDTSESVPQDVTYEGPRQLGSPSPPDRAADESAPPASNEQASEGKQETSPQALPASRSGMMQGLFEGWSRLWDEGFEKLKAFTTQFSLGDFGQLFRPNTIGQSTLRLQPVANQNSQNRNSRNSGLQNTSPQNPFQNPIAALRSTPAEGRQASARFRGSAVGASANSRLSSSSGLLVAGNSALSPTPQGGSLSAGVREFNSLETLAGSRALEALDARRGEGSAKSAPVTSNSQNEASRFSNTESSLSAAVAQALNNSADEVLRSEKEEMNQPGDQRFPAPSESPAVLNSRVIEFDFSENGNFHDRLLKLAAQLGLSSDLHAGRLDLSGAAEGEQPHNFKTPPEDSSNGQNKGSQSSYREMLPERRRWALVAY